MRAFTNLNNGDIVTTAGRNTSGDGGAATFVWNSASTTTTNLGTVLARTASPATGRFVWNGNGVLVPQMFGAFPNDSISDQTAIADAISVAESSGVNLVRFPAGVFQGLSGLTAGSVTLEGLNPNTTFISTNATTVFLHDPTATADLLIVTNGSGASIAVSPVIRNIFFVGWSGYTTPNKKAITAVDSKYAFRVANANAPTLSSVADNPKGVAFFYDSYTNYLGSGFITNLTVSGANTIVTLDPAFSLFASTDGTTNGWVTTTDTVTFAPLTSISGTPWADPSSAGYAAIRVANTTTGVKLENVSINAFHTGIHIAPSSSSSGLILSGYNSINGCNFAGLAGVNSTRNADVKIPGVLAVTGAYYTPAYGLPISIPTDTNNISYSFYRNAAFGLYNSFSVGSVNTYIADYCVTAYFNTRQLMNKFNYFLADNVIRNGAQFGSGFYPTVGGTGFSADYFAARTYLGSSASVAALLDKTVLKIFGTEITNVVNISVLDVPLGNGSSAFNELINITGLTGHSLYVDKLNTEVGTSSRGTYPNGSVRWGTPSDAHSATEQTDLMWRDQSGQFGFANAGTNVFKVGPLGVSYFNNVITSLGIVPESNATNVFSVSTSSGQVRARVDTTNGRTVFIGPGGAEGTEPAYNSGTVLVAKNNTATSDRARVAIVGGSAGFSILEMGSGLNYGLQYNEGGALFNLVANGAARMTWDTGGRVGVAATGSATPNTHVVMDFQGSLPIGLPRLTAAQIAAITGPLDGELAYQTDGTEGVYVANGSTFSRLAKASEITGGGGNVYHGTTSTNNYLTMFSGSTGTNIVQAQMSFVLGDGLYVDTAGSDNVYASAYWGVSLNLYNSGDHTKSILLYGTPTVDRTITLQDGNGTLAFLTDTVAAANVLSTARTINGVSFNGSANITVPGSVDVQTFTASGTWTKPSIGTRTKVIMMGGGSGGGSGAKNALATAHSGGAGGSAGGYIIIEFPTSTLGATETVTIGAGGAGGASVSADTTSGNAGSAGSASTFGTKARAPGGAASNGGSTSTATSGSAGGGIAFNGAGGNSTTGAAAVGSAGAYASGGGGGGPITGSAFQVGAAGGVPNIVSQMTAPAGGASTGAAGSAGTHIDSNAATEAGGAGGGGGASSILGAGGAGGAGIRGSGGGGGGASVNAVGNSGAGGAGGDGWCIVITY